MARVVGFVAVQKVGGSLGKPRLNVRIPIASVFFCNGPEQGDIVEVWMI